MKSFRIVSVDVKSDKGSVESFAAGRDARVVIGFDRSLTRLECKRVKDEVAKFVGDVERVSASGSKVTVRTRDFDSVGEFIDAANSYSQSWADDVAAEVVAAESALSSAGESVKSRVVYRVNGPGFG